MHFLNHFLIFSGPSVSLFGLILSSVGTHGPLWANFSSSRTEWGTNCAQRGAQGTLARNKLTHLETFRGSVFVIFRLFLEKKGPGIRLVFFVDFAWPLAFQDEGSHAIRTRLCSRNALFGFLHFSENSSQKRPIWGPFWGPFSLRITILCEKRDAKNR